MQEQRTLRYAASIEVHVDTGMRRTVSRTRDLSKGGLFVFCRPAPSVGNKVSVTLHPAGSPSISLKGVVKHSLRDIGAGIELDDVLDIEVYRALIDHIAKTTEAWETIGDFVRSNQEAEAAADAVLAQKEMYEVGETCEAIRILFELHPPVAIEDLDETTRESIGPATNMLEGVSSRAIGLKLHERDRLRNLFVGVMRQGRGYVAIVPAAVQDGPSVLYTLKGQELIMVAFGGKPAFPVYTPEHFHRISCDTVAVVPEEQTAEQASVLEAAPMREFAQPLEQRIPKTPTDDLPPFPEAHLPRATLGNWTRVTTSSQAHLNELFDMFGAETRVYDVHGKQRAVRLLRDLTLMVRSREHQQESGALFHDGERLCVLFGLQTRLEMKVRPLTIEDEVRIPALS